MPPSRIFLGAFLLMTTGCHLGGAVRATPEAADAVLDDFHAAASEADGERYFAHFAEDGVFLGTDASERWTVAEFRAYAEPFFAQGRGWTYHSRDRHLDFTADGTHAWFDEKLDNEKYGEVRGSGVLRAVNGVWKVVQYNLSFTVPNDVAADVVARIREFQGDSGR